MDEMDSPDCTGIGAARISASSLRRRRKPDVRSLATGVALVVAVAWTILFGVGLVIG